MNVILRNYQFGEVVSSTTIRNVPLDATFLDIKRQYVIAHFAHCGRSKENLDRCTDKTCVYRHTTGVYRDDEKIKDTDLYAFSIGTELG